MRAFISSLIIGSFTAFYLALIVPTGVSARTQADAHSGISQNWAGYQSVDGTFSGIGATWKVPGLKRTSVSSTYAVWIGLGGEYERELLQVGTHAIEEGERGVRYSAWYELFPDKPRVIPVMVRPGDAVTASVTLQSPGVWKIWFKNLTTKKSFATTVRRHSLFSSAEWIVEKSSHSLGGFTPFGDFGPVSFASAWTIKDKKQRTLLAAEALPITMVDFENKTLLAHVSATRADGQGFTVMRDKPGEPWWVPEGYQVSR